MPDRIVNLTPHEIWLRREGMPPLVFPPAEEPARCALVRKKFGYVELGGRRLPLSRLVCGEVAHLPPPRRRTWYIVSTLVAAASPERRDLLVPHRLIRQGGRVVGCRALVQLRADREAL